MAIIIITKGRDQITDSIWVVVDEVDCAIGEVGTDS
jgi:hypothetical protein